MSEFDIDKLNRIRIGDLRHYRFDDGRIVRVDEHGIRDMYSAITGKAKRDATKLKQSATHAKKLLDAQEAMHKPAVSKRNSTKYNNRVNRAKRQPEPHPARALDNYSGAYEIVYEIETQDIHPTPHAHIHIERRACKPLDYDNLVGGLKGTVDVLRALNLIANDDVRSVDIHYEQEATRRLWAKTIIRLWL
jgi:hypothetical protein